MIWPNGRIYTGEFRNDEIDGQGTCVFPNKEKYVGKVNPIVADFLGQWKKTQPNGKGVFTWPDGRVYDGNL